MPADIFSLSPVVLAKASGGGDSTLPTEAVGVPLGIIHNTHYHSGNIFPTLVAVPGANPRMTLSIPAHAAFTFFGLALNKLTKADAFLAKFADYNKDSGSIHTKIALNTACAAAAQITGWSVNVDGTLMCQVEIVPLSTTGQLHPLLVTTGELLPAISGTAIIHNIGPVRINGTIIPGLSTSSGSMGANVDVRRTDGDKFSRTAARLQAAPSFSLSHEDPSALLVSLTTMGVDLSSAGVEVFFRRYDPVTGVTDSTGGILLAIAKGRIHPAGPESSQGQVATSGIDVIGISDGSTNALAVTLSTAVPTPP